MTVYIVNTVPDDEYMGNVLFEADSPEEAIQLAIKDQNLPYRFRATATNLVFDNELSERALKFFKGELGKDELAEYIDSIGKAR